MPEELEKTVDESSVEQMLSAIRLFDSKEIPIRVQQIMAFRAMGFTVSKIAKMLGYKDASGVHHILARWDPTKEVERADSMRRLTLISMAEQIAFRSMLQIAKNVEVFDALPPTEHMKIVKDVAGFVKNMGGATRLKVAEDERRILETLRGEEVIEGEEKE